MQFLRNTMMPSVFCFVLSVVASTTAARADTPFFWDDFDRDVLEDTEVQWESVASYLEDRNLLVDPTDNETGGGVQAFLTPLSDFSIRTRVNFEGTEYHGPEPWFGVWFSDVSYFEPMDFHPSAPIARIQIQSTHPLPARAIRSRF